MTNTTMGNSQTESNGAFGTNPDNEEIQQQEEEAVKKKEDNQQSTVPFHELFVFADSKDVALMALGTVGAVAHGLNWPLTALILGNMIDAFGAAGSRHDTVKRVSEATLQFVYLAVGLAIGSTLQVSCWMATGERQAARIRNMYLKAILRQEIAFFDKYAETGEIIGRMSGDTVLIQDAMGEKVGSFIQHITTFCGGMVIAFAKGWRLASIMLLTVPPLILSTTITHSITLKMASLGQAAYSDAASVVNQTLGSIRTVASFTGETQVVNKYRQSLKNAYRSGVHEGLMAGLGRGSVMVSLYVAQALGTWYGSKLILRHGYTGAQVINVLFAIVSSCGELGHGLPCLTSFAAGQAAAYKIFKTINRKPEINSCSKEGTKLHEIRGEIEFSEVHFAYPTRPQEKILKGFSLSIPSGSTVALVGESGSGKSTVVALIERFYDPQRGMILIDGVDLRELQLKWIRGKIGLVSQEPVLFSGTIRENIAYGSDDASEEGIRSAAELANAVGFIDKMPKGFETLVGEHGAQLSGGQKQRIAIARAILKDPRILLLDEATSALDIESERIVQDALDRVMANRTTVVVAHRLSTVRNADTIVVLHHGSIVEQGPHSELVKDPKGAYNQLIRLQETSIHKSESHTRSEHTQASPLKNSNQSSSSSIPTEPPVATTSKENTSEHYEHTPKESAMDVSISRLATLHRPESYFLIFGCIASIVVGGIVFPVFGVILSGSIGTFYKPPHELRTQSNLWSCLYLGFAVVSAVADPVSSYSFAVAGARLIRRIRLITFEKVVNMDMSWFDDPENSSGAIGARLSANAAKVKSVLGDQLAVLLQNSATMVAGLLIAYASNWELALIASVMMPIVWINGTVYTKLIRGFSTDSKMMYEKASQVASAAVSSVRTVASFCAEEKVEKLYQKECDGPLRAGIKLGIVSGVGLGVSIFTLNCIFATIFYVGARLVQEGRTSFAVVFRIYMAISAMKETQRMLLAADTSKAKSAIAAVFATLDQKSRIDPSDASGQTMDAFRGDIEFRLVTFCYPSRPEATILRDFSLSIHAGQTVALVGESGSGKSTVISLLQRFYDTDSGHILLDGVEIRKFRVRWLRQQMGLVSQEPVLFNDTIRANIAYGKEGNATESEIVAAAELANVHKFVSSLPQGYDTTVGERGVQLSGGQKQRVAMARAILKEPKILLLDEATSALDVESERAVQEALDRVMVNRTSLMVAHRLSSVRNADVIAVVKDGMVVEQGNHDALIGVEDGAYAAMVTLHSSV